MALFTRAKQFGPVSQDYQQAIEKVTRSLSAFFGYSVTYIPDKLEAYIKDGYLLNADVYTVVNFIVRKTSGVSWNLYEVKDKKALKRYHNRTKKLSSQAQSMKVKALEEATDSELFDRLMKPNDAQGVDTFVSETIGLLALTGNFYWYALKPENGPNRGKTVQLMNLPPQLTQIITGSPAQPVAGYKVLYNHTVKYDPQEVYHCKLFNPEYGPNPASHLYGISPLRALSRMTYISNESIEANAKLLKHLGALGFITPEAAYSGDFTPEQGAALQKAIDKKYNNPSEYGKKVVASIPMKWQAFGQSVEDLAIMELQKVSFTKICNAYGLDPNLFGTDNMRDNNKQQAARDAWYNCIMYYLDKVKEGLNYTLADTWSTDGKQYYIDYDLSDVEELQRDMELMTRQAMANEVITVNEKRRMTGFDELEPSQGGENFIIPAGKRIIPALQPDQFDGVQMAMIGEYGVKGI